MGREQSVQHATWCIIQVIIKANTDFPLNLIKYKNAIQLDVNDSPPLPTAWDTKARVIASQPQPKAALPPTSVLRSPGGAWPNATPQLPSC